MKYTDKKGNVVKTVSVYDNIFRPVDPPKGFKLWLLKRMENHVNKIIRFSNWLKDHKSRERRIHRYVKGFLIHYGMKIADRIISRYMVKRLEDIPAQPYNNLVRMWYYSWNKGHEEMWTKMLYPMVIENTRKNEGEDGVAEMLKHHPTAQSYLNTVNNGTSRSYNVRKLMGDLYITEVLEDTADREMLNSFVLNLVHEAMEHYGVSGKEMKKVPTTDNWVKYKSKTHSNPNYFMYHCQFDTWQPKEYKDKDKEDKKDKNKEGEMENV